MTPPKSDITERCRCTGSGTVKVSGDSCPSRPPNHGSRYGCGRRTRSDPPPRGLFEVKVRTGRPRIGGEQPTT
ncbi:hypothetical protein BPORC_1865 [Bifidobacterium porcinum]|nr:hypothetical protein BPORC_1865 [Bifidobacterium porcinum]